MRIPVPSNAAEVFRVKRARALKYGQQMDQSSVNSEAKPTACIPSLSGKHPCPGKTTLS